MNLRVLLFIVVSIFFSLSSLGQSKAQLEKKRKEIQKEIKEAQTLLIKSKKEAETLLSELDDLNKIISIRARLIRTIDEEAEILSEAIAKNEKEIQSLEKNLAALKEEYANMVVSSYKSKSKQSRLMFLLSSESFAQAYKRLQYIKQYANYRKQQGEQIKISANELSVLTDSLREREDEKRLLIALHTRQKDSIDREKTSQVRLVGKVKAKEKKYISQIKKKQAEERKIDRQIDKLIAAAIAKSKEGTNKKASSGFHLTPEGKNLASDFVANKGKLPWPVKKGLVTRKYGTQPHPTLAGITIQSSGIHIATEKGAKAKAIFKGKVMSIQLQSGRKKLVLIQHGNYITAYTNLDDVLFKLGDTVNTGDEIGTIHTDAVNGKTILIFSLFKETKKLNPEPWIGKII
ncbi:peptidoglycan DD-metalloendopeptidase family protein [Aureibaculum sp. 2210JD6-5]|uniref:murein hydrolase activator EnvC family protein n=1 Tax=Aureibaculum sp. 2210JD6-5 TaxID=3103957 RepID=UPI002AAC8DDF|nr:peptidoglycan DD-metalloendopeptidase family protein [Aureibaculum sp. 2210JD6-5]MDY7394607.1 peptidoglycan DD-metalloendopeptidase family protein [Aureibaculum sp. 2210JD6-5]